MTDKKSSTLSAAKLALMVKEARAGLADPALPSSEPIAIVGIGCRLPGNISSAEQYWQFLRNGQDAITGVPAERWNADAYFDPDTLAPGKINSLRGGFLSEIDQFDPVFFGISSREVAGMDPQQRLLLEVVWEALWESGHAPESLSGSRTGVFVAICGSDYERLAFGNAETINAQSCSGTYHSVASGRISFLLDLRGPSLSVDTACSSSLVAVHIASQSLRIRESDLAIAGGVNLHFQPEHYIGLTKLGMISPDGKCKTFDSSANGFVPGEGCGIVVLKRLSDAIADGNPIHAVIRGTAVNQDGRTNVLTAPNGLAQQEVIRAALRNGQVHPADISYVETHGTGTVLGDPIEVESLTEVLSANLAESQDCFLGAVKTNLGHLEAAAGVAGLIKATLALEHEEIPRNIHFKSLNPHISLDKTRFKLPLNSISWPRKNQPRFAGISSFGFSGTNAHVILEEAPRLPLPKMDAGVESNYLLPISARTPEALKDNAKAYREYFAHLPSDTGLYSVCRSAALQRHHYEERLTLTAGSSEEFQTLLSEFLQGRTRFGVSNSRSAWESPGVVFVCSGQGSQWPGMGMSLYKREAIFRTAFDECDALIRDLAGWSLLEKLATADADSELGRTKYAQPSIFAVEIALARLWQSWGITPSAVIGHSAGEVAAACIAGTITLQESIRIVVNRGRLMDAATGLGKMAAIHLPVADVTREIQRFGNSLSVAAINSPNSTVISGDSPAVEACITALTARGIGCRVLPVDYAFHSAQMDSFDRELVKTLGKVSTSPASIAIISTVFGRVAKGNELDHIYWGRNIRQTVLFAKAVQVAHEMGLHAFVEIGSHPVLLNSVEECLDHIGTQKILVPSLRRKQDETKAMLTSLGTLHCAGFPIHWKAIYGKTSVRARLPVYPYQRQRFWLEHTVLPKKNLRHPLLGESLQSPAIRGTVFESHINSALLPYLSDHRIDGSVLFPMSGFLELAHCAVKEKFGGSYALKDFVVGDPLILGEGQTSILQTIIEGDEVRIFSKSGEDWKLHVRCFVEKTTVAANKSVIAKRKFNKSGVNFDYADFHKFGLEFGPSFRTLKYIHSDAQCKEGEAWAQVVLQDGDKHSAKRYMMHPALLDGCLQAAFAAFKNASSGTYLPFSIGRVTFFTAVGSEVWAHVTTCASQSEEIISADIDIYDDDGVLVASIAGLNLKRRPVQELEPIYDPHWAARERGSAVENIGKNWWIIAEDIEEGGHLANALKSQGHSASVSNSIEKKSAQLLPASRISRVVKFCSAILPGASSDNGQIEFCRSLFELAQDLLKQFPVSPPQLWLITRNAAIVQPEDSGNGIFQSPLEGLARSLAIEHPELKCVRLDLGSDLKDFQHVSAELANWDGSQEVALRNGKRYVRRLERVLPAAIEASRLTIPARGAIDNLKFEPIQRRAPGPHEVEVEVEASALNFRDVLNVLGMYPGDAGDPGLEFCGRIVRSGANVTQYHPGDRVMGIAWGSFASFVTTPEALVVRIPEQLDAIQAATIPNAFLTANHCFNYLGKMKPGQRVLIHAASGGVGLAAVQLAQRAGAEIFATAGSEAKREYLRLHGVRHVFSSRDLGFVDKISAMTAGQGVDLVLNSLAGKFIEASFSVLTNGGTFIEIGKSGVWSDHQVAALNRNLKYFLVDLGQVIESQPEVVRSQLSKIADEVTQGGLIPLPVKVFDFYDAPTAFRYMSQAKHVGKIVLRHPSSLAISSQFTYLITGGLGVLGLKTAKWMIEKGARNLVLISRHALTAEELKTLDNLHASGNRVEAYSCDISDKERLKAVFAEIKRTWPPLRGVVHSAGTLDDGVLIQQTWERMRKVLAPKVTGAWNLHELTKDTPLDFFILFSSMASLAGSPGQSGYAAGNAFLDALAHYRRALGLPALSVNWGAWADEGMAAQVEKRGQNRVLPAIRAMSPEDCLSALEKAPLTGKAQVAIADVNWSQWNPLPEVFQNLVRHSQAPQIQSNDDDGILARLEAAPAGNKRKIMVEFLRKRALHILGLKDSYYIDESQPLIKMGLDSLMAVEFRNYLAKTLNRSLTATLLFDYPTLGTLADFLNGTPSPKNPAPEDKLLAEIDTLSDEEAEELLKEELERS